MYNVTHDDYVQLAKQIGIDVNHNNYFSGVIHGKFENDMVYSMPCIFVIYINDNTKLYDDIVPVFWDFKLSDIDGNIIETDIDFIHIRNEFRALENDNPIKLTSNNFDDDYLDSDDNDF